MTRVLTILLIALIFISNNSIANTEDFAQKRALMVEKLLKARGITDNKVIEAFLTIPRHKFVSSNMQKHAYSENPLPIGQYQLLEKPYISAVILENAKIKKTDKVLEIGTGSGYQTAILSKLAKEVYSIEINSELAFRAKTRLSEEIYNNVHIKLGDGHKGWSENAPFDVIVASAAPEEIPQALIEQLKVGGKIITPLGRDKQELVKITKTANGTLKESILPVKFVPMIQSL